MVRISQSVLVKQIKRTLIQFWLFEEFDASMLTGIESCVSILRSVSGFAIDALRTTENHEDACLEHALVELCGVQHQDMVDAEQTLYQLLSELTGGNRDLTDQDRLDALEAIAMSTVQEIQLKSDFERARNELAFLEQIAMVAARLAYAGSAELSENMDVMIRDFEHADEQPVLRSIYEDMRIGKYWEGR